jgi:RNA polymerase sigma-70 factor, ECF subfamily
METITHWQPITANVQNPVNREIGTTPNEEHAVMIGVAPDRDNVSAWTDGQLMQAVAGGEAGALEVLYDRHVRGCFGLAMKIVRDPLIAEEVVQDVFMKLWSSPLSFAPERGKFSGWLLTLVHNRSVDKLRRLRTHTNQTTLPADQEGEGELDIASILADKSPGPDEMAWREERGEILRQYLGQLPEPQRQALAMAYFEGLTQREIAERLHQPIGTVKTRTRAALQQMRRLLNGQELLGEL